MQRASFLPLTALLAGLAPLIATAVPAAADTLQVSVEGVRNGRGQVLIAVHRRPESFPSQWQGAAKVGRVSAGAKQTQITFDDLPKGRYAVVVLHDEDGSGGMTSNGIGFPLEGFGTSNNPAGLGAPAFEPSALTVSGVTRITVKLKYP